MIVSYFEHVLCSASFRVFSVRLFRESPRAPLSDDLIKN